MANATGIITIKPSRELVDIVARLEASRIKLLEMSSGSESTITRDSTVRSYSPHVIVANVGTIELRSNQHGACTMTIDGQPVERVLKVVLTLEVDHATICAVTTMPDYRKREQGQ